MLTGATGVEKLVTDVGRELSILEACNFEGSTIADLQTTKLHGLMSRAATVPFYRNRAAALASCSIADLPVIEKELVRSHPATHFVAPDAPIIRYYETSGSTGVHTPAPRTIEDVILNAAVVAGLWHRFLPAGARVLNMLPSDIVPVADLVVGVTDLLGCATVRAYPFSQGITDWDRLESLVSSFAPDVLFAAPGVVVQWTRILKRRGVMKDVRGSIDRIMLLGEVSTRALRHKIGLEWNAVVCDASYGSTETGTVAAGCGQDRLHCLLHAHLLELRDGTTIRPMRPGQTGELVVTPLNAFARPLARFAVGDLVKVERSRCACGLGLPVMEVLGRKTDQVTAKGRLMTADALESVVYGNVNVTGYLVQLKQPDGAGARLLLERDVDAAGSDDEIMADIRRRSADAGFDWDAVAVVAQLPPTTKAGGSRKSWKRTNIQWV